MDNFMISLKKYSSKYKVIEINKVRCADTLGSQVVKTCQGLKPVVSNYALCYTYEGE